MPFNPTLPLTGSLITSAELRNQFTGLKDLIDAVAPPPAETDPVFAASEAALLGPGDKAKLDSAVQLEFDSVFAASEAAHFVAGDKAKLDLAFQHVANPPGQADVDAQPFYRPAGLVGRVNGGMPVTAGGCWAGSRWARRTARMRICA